jgi:predicted RNA-binding protein
MCESTVYLKTDQGEEMLMEEVARLVVTDSGILMSNLLGEERESPARISSIDFLDHRVTVVRD